jgi:chemotaxis methyl-accepting protein methylase
MNSAIARRVPELENEQLSLLMQQLHTHAGIRIDSTKNVIADSILTRMEYLGVNEVDKYLAAFDDSFNARAEWLALTDLLTV